MDSLQDLKRKHADVTEISLARLDAELAKSSGGGIKPTSRNVRAFLEQHPDLRGLVALDAFTGKRMVMRRPPWGSDDRRRPWSDTDTCELLDFLQGEGMDRISRTAVEDGLTVHAGRNEFHQVRDYLAGLEWDGQERLDILLPAFYGTDETPYSRAVGRMFLVSAVARVMAPGSKADHMLVLEGPQGAGKSSSLYRLSPDPSWVCEHLPDFDSKDALAALHGSWLVEVSELSAFRKSEIEGMKSFLSRQVDTYRRPYDRHAIEAPRQCVFVGTTNEDRYLVDTSGNRRFWPVRCGKIDLAALEEHRDQLWAEAAARYQDGEPWHITDNTMRLAARAEQASREIEHPWLPILADYLMHRVRATSDDLMALLDIPRRQQSGPQMRLVYQLARKLGWESRRDQSGGRDRIVLEPAKRELRE